MALIRCQCGTVLPRPLPLECPQCGVLLRSARRRLWPLLITLAVIVGLFGVLVAVVLRLTGKI